MEKGHAGELAQIKIKPSAGTGKRKSILVGIVILLCLAGGAVFFSIRLEGSPVSPLQTPENASLTAPISQAAQEPEMTFEDEWGFKLSYPKSLTAKAATGAGELTRWEFSSPTYDGKINVWTKEATEDNLADWLKNDPAVKGTTATIDSALGGGVAKKINLDNPRRIWVAAIDSGQLFVVELEPGSDRRMEQAYNWMVDSFEFLPFPTEPGNVKNNTTPADDGEGVVEEGGEEIVE